MTPQTPTTPQLATSMTPPERRSVAALVAVFGLRMFGLFMLLPVLSPFAAQFPQATPLLVGMAVGIYGLTQAALQIPLGVGSDYLGRKAVISGGLLLFAAGSLVAARADSIAWLIVGRAIQGAGAISAAVLALTADLTRETVRAKAMAWIGVSIGGVFLLALMLAAPLQGRLGVTGMFELAAVLACGALVVLVWLVPTPSRGAVAISPRAIKHTLLAPWLLALNLGGFFLHLCLTALFVTLPDLLQTRSGFALAAHWKLYAPVLLLSVLGMLPLLVWSGRRRSAETAFTAALWLLLAGGLALVGASRGGGSLAGLLGALWVFFVAFNTLEALLPSAVSRLAAQNTRGAALGAYNTYQFIGMFAGGAGAGWVSAAFGAGGVYWLCAASAGLWLVSRAWLRRRVV